MNAVSIGPPATPAQWEAYYDLRWRILRAPWGAPRGSERDEHEADAIHAAAWDPAGRLVGVGRAHRLPDGSAQIRYMAVEPAWRGRGVGAAILAYLEARLREQGVASVVLNARASVIGFYEKHGYRRLGPGPTLFGVIEHVRMGRELQPTDAAAEG